MTTTRRWLVLGVVLMGTFMAVLDVAIVNVAIPSIHADLGASYGEIEFVVSAYTLTYACLLVTGGRLGDNYGRKLLFIIGLVVFARGVGRMRHGADHRNFDCGAGGTGASAAR